MGSFKVFLAIVKGIHKLKKSKGWWGSLVGKGIRLKKRIMSFDFESKVLAGRNKEGNFNFS